MTESMPDPLPIQAKHEVKLQCGVDRALAARVDATAKQYDVPRAAVIRAALEQSLPKALKNPVPAGFGRKKSSLSLCWA